MKIRLVIIIMMFAYLLTACGEDEVTGESSSSSSSSSTAVGETSSLSLAASSASSASQEASEAASNTNSNSASSEGESSSSVSSQADEPSCRVRFYSGRLVCDAEDDAGNEAEFYGKCQVTATLDGVELQAFDGGYPVTGYLWEVEAAWAEEWALQPDQWKLFNRQRYFSLPQASLAECVFRIRAHLLEKDTLDSDDMGWQEVVVRGNAIEPGITWLPTFSHGGTRARIGVMIAVE